MNRIFVFGLILFAGFLAVSLAGPADAQTYYAPYGAGCNGAMSAYGTGSAGSYAMAGCSGAYAATGCNGAAYASAGCAGAAYAAPRKPFWNFPVINWIAGRRAANAQAAQYRTAAGCAGAFAAGCAGS